MKKNELKRLSRGQLLEIMLEQEQENARLRSRIDELQARLDEKDIRSARCGSLAEAALAASGLFEAADAACRIYKESIENMQSRLRERVPDAEPDGGNEAVT